jgi:hypothetical protein
MRSEPEPQFVSVPLLPGIREVLNARRPKPSCEGRGRSPCGRGPKTRSQICERLNRNCSRRSPIPCTAIAADPDLGLDERRLAYLLRGIMDLAGIEFDGRAGREVLSEGVQKAPTPWRPRADRGTRALSEAKTGRTWQCPSLGCKGTSQYRSLSPASHQRSRWRG